MIPNTHVLCPLQVMSLSHSPDKTLVDSALASMREIVNGPDTKATNQQVLRLAGLNVAEGMVAFQRGHYKRAIELIYPVRQHWLKIGGSHAQRDVIMLTLLEACLRVDTDLPLALRLLAERMIVKDPENQGGTRTLYNRTLDKITSSKMDDDDEQECKGPTPTTAAKTQ